MDKNSAAATPAPMAKAKGTIQSSPSLGMSGRIAKRHCGRQGTRSSDSTIRSAITALATSPPRAALPGGRGTLSSTALDRPLPKRGRIIPPESGQLPEPPCHSLPPSLLARPRITVILHRVCALKLRVSSRRLPEQRFGGRIGQWLRRPWLSIPASYESPPRRDLRSLFERSAE